MFENDYFIIYPDIESMKSALLNEEIKYVLHDAIDFQSNRSFEVLHLSDSIKYKSSFALQKESEFTQIFNYHIAKLDETGVLDTLRLKYLQKSLSVANPSKSITLGFNNVLFPFLILMLGILFGVGFSLYERALFCW